MWWTVFLPLALALHTFEPPLPASITRENTLPEYYYDVRTHHFDAANTDVFGMRFYYNDVFANSSDIVIFVGGEWEISPGWLQTGLAYELAQHLQAGLFYTEHRYYGHTRPTNDTSIEALRFLTVDQALADLAQIIQIIRSDRFENGRYKDGKVALVGCSYAGTMATWMRLAYPHIVHAAFSDSGPLHAQEDFPEYLEVITEALRVQGSEECLSTVERAMEDLVALLETSNGPATVSTLFNTCAPLDASSQFDLATFFWYGITETFAYLVQTASPGDIERACNTITDTEVASDPVGRLAAFITSHPWTSPCIEARFSEQMARHTNVSFDAEHTTMRLWTYQTCVEFGWYQTTSSSRQPFLSTVPLEYFHHMCKNFFSSYFDESLLRSGIERTNIMFGGLQFLPDRVVSVQGGHDPWSPMGPNVTHATSGAPVYVVPGISHCRAIQSTASSDTEDLAQVKKAVLNHMYKWMTGEDLFDVTDSASRVAGSILIGVSVLAVLLMQ